MPPEVFTVWDGTRQRDPYLGLTYQAPRAPSPAECVDRAEPPLCLRCSLEAFEDQVRTHLRGRPMTIRDLVGALAPDTAAVHLVRVANRVTSTIRRLRFRGDVVALDRVERPAGPMRRVSQAVYAIAGAPHGR